MLFFNLLIIALRIISVMALFLFLVLKTGRRKIAELPVLFAVVLIIALQYLVSSLLINNKKIARKITFGPTVIIQNGQFIKLQNWLRPLSLISVRCFTPIAPGRADYTYQK